MYVNLSLVSDGFLSTMIFGFIILKGFCTGLAIHKVNEVLKFFRLLIVNKFVFMYVREII